MQRMTTEQSRVMFPEPSHPQVDEAGHAFQSDLLALLRLLSSRDPLRLASCAPPAAPACIRAAAASASTLCSRPPAQTACVSPGEPVCMRDSRQ